MVKPAIDYDVKDLALANEGNNRIEWAAREMPVIRLIRERFAKERPLDGLQEILLVHGFPQIGRDPSLRRAHAHLDIVVSCDEDDG